MVVRTITTFTFAILMPIFLYGHELTKPDKNNKAKPDTLQKQNQSILEKACLVQEGFITIVKGKGRIYFAIPDSIMDRDLLLVCRVEKISNNKIISAGQIRRDPALIRFSKRQATVVLERPLNNKELIDSPELEGNFAANNSSAESEFFEIAEYNKKLNASIIDVTKLFSDEIDYVSPWSGKKPGKLDQRGVSIDKIKANRETVEISTVLLYESEREPIKVMFRYSLALLSKTPMQIRLDDSRVGFAAHTKKEFRAKTTVETTKFISRWRMEPKEEDKERYFAGELVEPKNPIVFYVDTAMPKEWRGYARQGIEDWQKAFEEIGFKNAIIAKDYPSNDPNFDQFDFRYNCLRYLPVEDSNASGEHYYDPRSGEIIHADIFWYHNVIKLLKEWRFVQTAAVDTSIQNYQFSDEEMGEMIRYAVAHETGHTLGLEHNMRASYAFPVDSLRSATFTHKYGTTASIMDYARNNYVAQPSDKGVKLTPPLLGDYDKFAIKFGYKLIQGNKDPYQERVVIEQWLRENGTDPRFLYSPNTISEIKPDPAGQTDAIGDDAIKAGQYGISNLQYIIKNMAGWTYSNDASSDLLNELYDALSKQYRKMIYNALAYLGGEYQYFGTLGQYSEFYRPVKPSKQKQSLEFIIKETRDIAWLNEQSVTKYIGIKTSDIYKYQGEIVDKLLGNFIPVRIAQYEGINEQYTVSEYISELTNLVIKPNKTGNLTVFEKNLQIVTIKKLISLGQSKDLQPELVGMPASISSSLKQAKATLQQQLLVSKNKTDKEHFQYLISLIDKY